MAYCTTKTMPQTRGKAMKMLIIDKRSIQVVANRFGVNRTTIWRWYKKWIQQNKHIQFTNDNRPHRQVGKVFRWSKVKWSIPTITSAPHTHPLRIQEPTIRRIIELRRTNRRCAEVIHHQLLQEGFVVSLSSVKRTLDRYHYTNHWSKWKKRHTNTPRPIVTAPGELVEVDTVHYVDSITGKRVYITTIIDLYTRMSYARPSYKLSPGEAARAILLAEQKLGIKFVTVQSDNGPEFSSYFTTKLKQHHMKHRHTRVHKPNDNAHIERFNRTLRDECIGHHKPHHLTLAALTNKLNGYLDYYNHDRIHLGLQCRTPIQMLQR